MSTWHTKDAHSGGYKKERNKDGVRCKIKQHNGKPTCQKTFALCYSLLASLL